MFTICPKCALTLVVTAADLRVAQGHVRCGRCSSVFNALARLTEERQVASPEASSPPLPPAPSPVEPQPEAPAAPSADPTAAADMDVIPEEALEFNPATTNAESVFVQPRPDPQWEAATGSFKAMVAANQEPLLGPQPDGLVEVEMDSGFLSEIIKADARGASQAAAPTPAPAAAPVPAAAPAPTPAAEPTASTDLSASAPRQASSAPAIEPARTTGLRPARPAPDAADHPPPATTAREPAPARPEVAPLTVHGPEPFPGSAALQDDDGQLARSPPYGWIVACAGATLLLAAQIVNHYRDDLAARARFNHPLTAVYRALGVTLEPRWDLHAYDVRQLGAAVDPADAGEITVRASIKNTGQQPQPLPLLRVTLQDRFGNRIAARDVPPQFYVPGAVPAAALLGAGQRIDAEMAFLDPGATAVGFELDACLPASGGGIACASDAGARE